jgi:hypothetical protein
MPKNRKPSRREIARASAKERAAKRRLVLGHGTFREWFEAKPGSKSRR